MFLRTEKKMEINRNIRLGVGSRGRAFSGKCELLSSFPSTIEKKLLLL
jgi:hypothetical protein